MSDADKFVLRSTVTSPFGRKVRMAIDVLKLADRIKLEPADPLDDNDTLRQQNPLGKMPCLVLADGSTIYDSGIIIEYLQDVAGTDRLLPLKGRDRYRALTAQSAPQAGSNGTAGGVAAPSSRQGSRGYLAWLQTSAERDGRAAGCGLIHYTNAVSPLRTSLPFVVTIHDLSFATGTAFMGRRDRSVFRRVVPRAVRGATRVLTVSERTKRDLVEIYGVPAARVVVTPNGVDPAFHPGEGERDYVLVVGAIQARKNQLAAVEAANAVGLPVIVAGPEKDRSLADELRRRGARLEGYVEPERLAELYRGAACLVQPSRFEGFGLPVLEAMASGTPVVAVPEPALEEVAGDAALFVEEERLADGIRQALADRDRLVWAGLVRARQFSWRATAEKTLAVYLEVLER